jgi:hypothetical protein
MIYPFLNNFSHRKRNLKSCCPPPFAADRTPIFFYPLNFFFYLWTFFVKDRRALELMARLEILYTTLEKPFLRQRDKRSDRTPIFTTFSFTKPCRIASAFFHETQ